MNGLEIILAIHNWDVNFFEILTIWNYKTTIKYVAYYLYWCRTIADEISK